MAEGDGKRGELDRIAMIVVVDADGREDIASVPPSVSDNVELARESVEGPAGAALRETARVSGRTIRVVELVRVATIKTFEPEPAAVVDYGHDPRMAN